MFNRPTRKIYLYVVVVILLTLGTTAQASDESLKLHYIPENFQPYNYMENGEIKGFAVDLLKLIWREMGIDPQPIDLYPWARAYNLLMKENHTVLFTTVRTQERENLFKWACPIKTGAKSVLIGRKDRAIEISSIADANRYKIGTIRDDAAGQILISLGYDENNAEPVSRLIQNIRKLDNRRIDLIAYNEDGFYQTLAENNFNPDEYETVFILQEIIPCYAFNKNISDQFVTDFQTALDKVRQEPVYKNLLNKYFPED